MALASQRRAAADKRGNAAACLRRFTNAFVAALSLTLCVRLQLINASALSDYRPIVIGTPLRLLTFTALIRLLLHKLRKRNFTIELK